MLQQAGDPLRVFDIGLVPRHGLDMPSVCHHQLKMSFKQVIYWSPVYTRCFHSYMCAACRFEPISQLQQGGGGGPKRSDLLAPLAICCYNDQAGDDHLLVNIEPATALVDHFHVVTVFEHLFHVLPTFEYPF